MIQNNNIDFALSMNSPINKAMLYKAKTDDAFAQYQVAVVALHHNKIGFAWAFMKLAAQTRNSMAQKCLTILENPKLPETLRIKQCCELIQ